MKTIPKQFDIYQANLNPRRGSEQAGMRPCLILQTNGANAVARTFLMAPLTSQNLEMVRSYQVLVKKSRHNGLKVDSKIKLDQLRVIDKSRLVKKMGHLEVDYYPSVFQAIDVMIDRFGDFRA